MKILVIDDSETVRSQLRRDLVGFGYEVVEAEDGVVGLSQALAHKPDLILCDVNMPNLDGLSMIRHLRKEPGMSALPIFMLTTESSSDLKATAKELGIRAWITKPHDPVKLNLGIRKVLGMNQT